jgi:hypothetical protein
MRLVWAKWVEKFVIYGLAIRCVMVVRTMLDTEMVVQVCNDVLSFFLVSVQQKFLLSSFVSQRIYSRVAVSQLLVFFEFQEHLWTFFLYPVKNSRSRRGLI